MKIIQVESVEMNDAETKMRVRIGDAVTVWRRDSPFEGIEKDPCSDCIHYDGNCRVNGVCVNYKLWTPKGADDGK